MPFPSGSISVRDASYEDVTSGKQWFMPHANNVQFLKVRGVIVIGDVPLSYKFTLVKYDVKTRERRGNSFSQLGLEPNHTGLTAQSLFFLEESCRVKRSDTQTFSNFSNYFKRVLKLQKRSSSFSK